MRDLRSIDGRQASDSHGDSATPLDRLRELIAEARVFGDDQNTLAGHRGLQRRLHPNKDSNRPVEPA
jgi:hypothetical protein